MRIVEDKMTGRAVAACAGLALSLVAGQALAVDIALVDHSFEELGIPTPGEGASISEGVLPFVQSPFAPFNPNGWQETGVVSTEQGFTGFLDAGVFLNVPFDLGGGFLSPTVLNPDGTHVAFLRANSLANSVGPATTISQQTTENFQAFTAYTFTVALGQGQLQPPGSTDPVNNPYNAVISIGYYDNGATADGGFTALASESIDAVNDLVGGGSGELLDFSVTLETTDVLPDNPLVIHIAQSGGTTGSINVDNARLTAVPVPEPTSLALLAVGGAMLTRRRRR